jgi:hypothetical protein
MLTSTPVEWHSLRHSIVSRTEQLLAATALTAEMCPATTPSGGGVENLRQTPAAAAPAAEMGAATEGTTPSGVGVENLRQTPVSVFF